nr:MAG TPA: hypothetical protein [Caudoviricetes sp.]
MQSIFTLSRQQTATNNLFTLNRYRVPIAWCR